jgi:hypothetical protein
MGTWSHPRNNYLHLQIRSTLTHFSRPFESFPYYIGLMEKKGGPDLLVITDSARDEFKKMFATDDAANKHLVLFFQGFG